MLYTGDLGKIDKDGYIYIYGRNNDLIVLSNGKKVFPEEIESKLNEINGIKESLVFEKNDKINAKIIYSSEEFYKFSEDEVYNKIMEKIKQFNEKLPQYKKINDIIITSKELEKTATGKIKRNLEYDKIEKVNVIDNVKIKDDDIFERIENILVNKLGHKDIKLDSNIISDLGADSLDMVEIFLEIERKFEVKIDKEQRKNITKVSDIINVLNFKI